MTAPTNPKNIEERLVKSRAEKQRKEAQLKFIEAIDNLSLQALKSNTLASCTNYINQLNLSESEKAHKQQELEQTLDYLDRHITQILKQALYQLVEQNDPNLTQIEKHTQDDTLDITTLLINLKKLLYFYPCHDAIKVIDGIQKLTNQFRIMLLGHTATSLRQDITFFQTTLDKEREFHAQRQTQEPLTLNTESVTDDLTLKIKTSIQDIFNLYKDWDQLFKNEADYDYTVNTLVNYFVINQIPQQITPIVLHKRTKTLLSQCLKTIHRDCSKLEHLSLDHDYLTLVVMLFPNYFVAISMAKDDILKVKI